MSMFHLYGLFIGIAVVAGWSAAEHIEPKVNKVAPWVIGLGMIGARIYHVIDLWAYYSQNLAQIVMVWKGGMSIWGGLIGGGVGFWIGSRGTQNQDLVDRWKMLGAIVMALPLAQAIGRLGNAVNSEFTNLVWVLPWWGAEIILDLILFGLIWRLRGQSSKVRVGVYLVGYVLIRLVLQPYRL